MNDNKQKSTFFGDDVKFWLGRVVSYSAQEQQASGTASWGWRYKVRVFGAYSDDEITDSDVVYATCMIPNTAGTGAAGGYKTCLLYTSPSPRDRTRSRMPSSA